MGNCESLSSDVKRPDRNDPFIVINGCDAAANVYSRGLKTGTRVKISMQCRDLPNMDLLSLTDAFVVVYNEKANGVWEEIGRTEIVVNNLNPVFVTPIIITYKFETIQRLKFAVYDADENAEVNNIQLDHQDFIGEATEVLSNIFHRQDAPQLSLTLNGQNRGSIILKCEELTEAYGIVKGCLKGQNIKGHCFYVVFSVNEKNGETPMYRSEVKKHGNWSSFNIDSLLFCNGDLVSNKSTFDYQNRPVIIRVYKYKARGNHVLIGSLETNTRNLIGSVNKALSLTGENDCSILVDSFVFTPKPSFLQFIQHGLIINFMVAVDFTSSNGDPNDIRRGIYNPYEKAIKTVSDVLVYYDTDQLFPCYGFGACLNHNPVASSCFALNGNEVNPNVNGIDGILQAYHNTLNRVQFSGPTLFAEVLKKANSMCYRCPLNQYLVLLIITDGEIQDMDASIQQIVEGADLPLSIIIVGVGNNDFTNMKILDGDDKRLEYNEKVASRDIVQFVALNDMENLSPEEIAKELLEEIPGQVTDYMEQHNVTLHQVRAISGLN